MSKVIELSTALNKALEKVKPVERPRPDPACDLLLVDISHLFWSAWHATAAEDMNRAVSLSMQKLSELEQDIPHNELAVCIDSPPYWRTKLLPSYKAHRSDPNEYARSQLKELLRKIDGQGYKTAWSKGSEADDVIAHFVRLIARDRSVTFATADKDLAQLVRDKVVWYDTRTRKTYGVEEVRERFGVYPNKIRDLLTIVGDKADNIDGVQGVGIKTASRLLVEHGSLDTVLRAAAQRPEPVGMSLGLAQKLMNHHGYELAWKLVGLQVPVGSRLKGSYFEEKDVVHTEKEKVVSRLKNAKRGVQAKPVDIVLYGGEGLGKSTFAAGAPSPFFIDLEGGTDQLDVDRDNPTKYSEVKEVLQELREQKHDYRTLVIDTVDALEHLLHQHICHKTQKSSIEDFGFGKGYEYALSEWQILRNGLEQLRDEVGMNIILVAHAQIQRYSNPAGEDYDRFSMKLNKKASALLRERATDVLFVTQREEIKGGHMTKAKALGEGARVIRTRKRPAYDAKNRNGLPDEMPLNWDEYYAAVLSNKPMTEDEITSRLDGLGGILSGDDLDKFNGYKEKAGGDPKKLAQLINWAEAKI